MTAGPTAGRKRQREEQFRLLIESVRDYAIFMLDPDGYVVSWNAGAQRIKGYAADEIVGKHFSVFYPPEAIARNWPQHELDIAAEAGRYEEDGWRLRKDGRRFWANVVITALRDPDGRLVGYAKVTRDLTERYTVEAVTEAALAHLSHDQLLHELLQRVADALSADTAAILLVEDGENVLVPRAACGLEAASERQVRIPMGRGFAGRIASERRTIVVDDAERAQVLNPVLLENGVRSLVGVPLVVEGRVLGVMHVGSLRPRAFDERDVHLLQIVGDRVALAVDRRRLFEAMRSARRDAATASAMVKERDEFLSVAAHELKTPMTSVKVAAQLLLRAFPVAGADARQRKALELIDRQVTKLGKLVVQLLETARLQAGQLVLRPERTDVAELVRTVAEQIEATTDREIFVTAPDELVADVDPLRLEQVITNLLDNAVKYASGSSRIDVTLAQPSTGIFVLKVRDRGIGVPQSARAHLFERFYQAHTDRSGMGLGLYISRRIVERHGGTIYAEFPPDGGSRFVVSMPTTTTGRDAEALDRQESA